MYPFMYVVANSINEAIELSHDRPDSRFLAGGTTLVDLMKSGPERPSLVIDINQLHVLTSIEHSDEPDALRIGALSRMSDVAAHMGVRQSCPAVAESLLFAASGRCLYFRDRSFACNKREPGSGCSAINGENRNLAVLGISPHCIANYPGDFAVALTAFDGVIHTSSSSGNRSIPARQFYTLPGDRPHIENVLEPGELITHIVVPLSPASKNSHYLKVRDRASYEFASVSVAAAMELEADGTIADVRVALVIPWRAIATERILLGKRFDDAATIKRATDAVLSDAKPQSHNSYKISQARAAIPRALRIVASIAKSALAQKGS